MIPDSIDVPDDEGMSLAEKLREEEGEELFHAFAEGGLVYIMWHEEDEDVQVAGGLNSDQARAIAEDLPDEADGLADELERIADVADTQIVRMIGEGDVPT